MSNITIQQQMSAELSTGLDTWWCLLASMLVFFMQVGFVMLEAGTVRDQALSVQRILLKNATCPAIGTLCYVFSALFIAPPFPAGTTVGWDAECLFAMMFSLVAATIVSGAVAERMEVFAYCLFTMAITGVGYPWVAYWMWHSSEGQSPGWAANLGCIDFSGSGVVHLLGGVCGLCGT
jgi:Amt family ammonium transporter